MRRVWPWALTFFTLAGMGTLALVIFDPGVDHEILVDALALLSTATLIFAVAVVELQRRAERAHRELVSDLDRRTAIERDLRHKEELLAQSQRHARVGSLRYDLAARTVEWSDETFRILGFEPGKVDPNVEWLDWVHPDDLELVQMQADAHIRDLDTAAPFECRIVWPDNSLRHVHLEATCTRSSDGRATEMLVTLQDITKLREAVDALHEASAGEALVANVSRKLLATDPEAVVQGVESALRSAAFFLGADRATMERVNLRSMGQSRHVTSYCSWPEDPGTAADLESELRVIGSHWLRAELKARDWVAVADTAAEIPAEAECERRVVEALGARSIAWLAIRAGGVVTGVVTFVWRQENATRLDERLQSLRLLGDVLLVALDRRTTELARRDAESELRAIFQTTPVGMAVIDVDGTTIDVNPSLTQILGYSADELIGRSILEITLPEDREYETEQALSCLAGDIDRWRCEKRYLDVNGDEIWVVSEVSLMRDADGNPHRFVGQMTDITERKRLEAQLARDATRDALTGLPNRILLMDRLRTALERAQRHGTLVALLFLDLDRFKLVNDTHGHAAGDRLLVEVSDRLEGLMRAGDTVARIGGDEFLVLCEEVDNEADAVMLARHIIAAVESPFAVGRGAVYVGASVGVAISDGSTDAEDVIRNADVAVYRAKDNGRSRIEVFDADMRATAQARLTLETDLRNGIERGELRCYYQPIIDLATGNVRAFEALARWEHPTRGTISPAEFIPIAEETGLIVAVGHSILRMACTQAVEWRRDFGRADPPSVSVNISGRQLAEADLVEQVIWALEESGLEPGALCLEISETSLMHDVDAAILTLDHLRKAGVKVAIDNFGTGHSSLTYLRRFPIDVVKIDQSFTQELGTDSTGSTGSTIVAAVISLAHAMHLTVVAEGVEAANQLMALEGLHCNAAQGFFFAPPLPAAEVGSVLEEGVVLHTSG
ncbi:MAG: diguanylate cyclase/phosphodiesterase with sensor [Actinomycetia bacterium]|nr:diguanylate cyclase/phosphodiesterase with sensor [Actinomycetes bacterium]